MAGFDFEFALSTPLPAVGKAARLLRQEAGLSQEDVARRGDVSLTHITRLENGRSNPTYKILERIVLGIGVSCAELFSLAGVLARNTEA
ncbi:MAG: helix-turn-helix domain-containing protein [Solirubrobacterales bacterium]